MRKNKKIFRITIYLKPVLFVLLAAVLSFFHCRRSSSLTNYDFGGDFSLTDQYGKAFNLKDLRGKTVLLFFGYTLCPDICPTTLSKIRKSYEILGSKSENIRIVFISVDPERDTKDKIEKYLSYFNMNVIGLTGSMKEIQSVTESYHAIFEKAKVNDSAAGYLVNHSAFTYLIDKNGKIRYLFRQSENPELMAAIIKILLEE